MWYDETRWKAADDAWRMRHWFEKALTGEMGYPQDRHIEEELPEFPDPEPEPTLTFHPCCGCGVEYILTKFQWKYALHLDASRLLCDYCEEVQQLQYASRPKLDADEANRRVTAERRARVERRRVADAKKRAIRALAEALRRIAQKRATDPQ